MYYKYYTMRRFDSNCFVFEFDPNKIRFDATLGIRNKLEKLSTITGEPKENEIPIAKINGGFFNMDGSREALGTFVDEGLYYSAPTRIYAIGVYWKTNKLNIEFEQNVQRHVTYQFNANWAIGCPWALIVNGKKYYHFSKEELIANFGHPWQKAPRTLIGQKSDGTIVWVVVDGRTRTNAGVSLPQSQDLMEELGCVNALNLDGGGSSEMIVFDDIKNTPSDGAERRIGTAFMAYLTIDSDGLYGSSTANSLNIRKNPTSDSDSLGTIPIKTLVHIIGYTKGWYKIKYNNTTAYVSSSYIDLLDSKPTYIPTPIQTTTTPTVIYPKEDQKIDNKSISFDELTKQGITKINL